MSSYSDSLRKAKSLLIVTSLQNRPDIKAYEVLKNLEIQLRWEPLDKLMIDEEVWDYVVNEMGYDPKFVFCHPEVILKKRVTSFYYRGLTGLSIKAAKGYLGAVENIEKGNKRAKLSLEKALKMARTYNTYISSIIKGSTDWTLENGKRTIVATIGITVDGIARNNIGKIAEDRIREMVYDWLQENNLIVSPTKKEIEDILELPKVAELKDGIVMRFSSEPDISFLKKTSDGEILKAIVEIKGGTDPAGALERYGAASKSFQQALQQNPLCKNFFLSAVFTDELRTRINRDRLVEKDIDIIEALEKPEVREDFFNELFHYCLRII